MNDPKQYVYQLTIYSFEIRYIYKRHNYLIIYLFILVQSKLDRGSWNWKVIIQKKGITFCIRETTKGDFMTSLLNANSADVNDACYFGDPILAYDLFETKYRVSYN